MYDDAKKTSLALKLSLGSTTWMHCIWRKGTSTYSHFRQMLLQCNVRQDFLKGGGNSWLTYLASTFGRPEMSRVPFEQVLDICKQKNRRIEL